MSCRLSSNSCTTDNCSEFCVRIFRRRVSKELCTFRCPVVFGASFEARYESVTLLSHCNRCRRCPVVARVACATGNRVEFPCINAQLSAQSSPIAGSRQCGHLQRWLQRVIHIWEVLPLSLQFRVAAANTTCARTNA